MDAISESTTHLGDFTDVDSWEDAAADIVLADSAYHPPVRARIGVDVPAFVHATPPHTVEVLPSSPLAQLRVTWDGLPPAAKVGLAIVGGAVALTVVASIVSVIGAKVALGHAAAAVAAAPLATL